MGLIKLPPHKRKSTLELAGTVNLGAGNWQGRAKLKLDELDDTGQYKDFPENELVVTLTAPSDPETMDWVVQISKPANLQDAWPVDTTVIGDIVYFTDATPAREVATATFILPIILEVTGDVLVP